MEARGQLRVLLCALTISILVRHQGWAPEGISLSARIAFGYLFWVLDAGRICD